MKADKYFIFRFPQILKIHENRSFKETVSFEEIQKIMRREVEAAEDMEREEIH
jgi:DNA ligase 4